MRQRALGLTAATLLALSAGTAAAADLGYGSTKDAVAAPDCCQVNWNGLYLGLAYGHGIALTDADLRTSGFSAVAFESLGDHGYQGVISIGYDRMIRDGIVIGVVGDYAFGDIEAKSSFGGGALRIEAEVSDSWSIGGRLGFVRSCCTMWYTTAGYAQADFEFRLISFGPGASSGKTLSGWFIGSGVEQQVRDNLFVKMEYRFTSYGDERLDLSDFGPGLDVKTETDVHSVRVGVNWKFDLFHGRDHASASPPLK